MTLEDTILELRELMKPYLVCVCDDPVEGDVVPERFTFRCAVCMGMIPLKVVD